MSAQFGRWNIDGRPLDPDYLTPAEGILAPYGPDTRASYAKGEIAILFRALHTTLESRQETGSHVLTSGSILTWDGRLDNRAELLCELKEVSSAEATDAVIVAAAYKAHGTGCFAKLIGDWALSIWEPGSRSLILAKDPVGTRPLYYSFDKNGVTWSSILDPLVLLAGKSFTLEEEYLAGWLAFFPAAHLTPYAGVHSVPPSCFVRLTPERRSVSMYWDFDPSLKIRYGSDRDYEEHFRQVFALSVRRRLRSTAPVLAELSGGMDSSSIVCMADALLSRGDAETPLLDTISYYNDSEPNWNERPYFSKVEEKRGRAGCHIDVASQDFNLSAVDDSRFIATPGTCIPPTKPAREFRAHLAAHGYRVLLSGVGGDEFTGGVPTPVPELADLFASAHFGKLVRRLKVWALAKRQPWLRLLHDTAFLFLPPWAFGTPLHKAPPVWLHRDFVNRNRSALGGYAKRLKFFGPLPTFQENLASLDNLRRQLACQIPPSEPPYEKRYPYLDRTLLEFLCAIPREQLVRPGQRRSLMRRSLAEIVPAEILERKRKAYVARAPLLGLARALPLLERELPFGQAAGIFDSHKLAASVKKAMQGGDTSIIALQRILLLEGWLARLASQSLICGLPPISLHHADGPFALTTPIRQSEEPTA